MATTTLDGKKLYFKHGFWFDGDGDIFIKPITSIIKCAIIYWVYRLRAIVLEKTSNG